MPYGTPSPATVSIAEKLGFDAESAVDSPYRLDIVVAGALDESFNVDPQHVDHLFEALVADCIEKSVPDADLANVEWEISMYDESEEPPRLVVSFSKDDLDGD